MAARQGWQWGVGMAGLCALLVCAADGPAPGQVQREALRPGLVATHRDAKAGVTVVQLEPTIALALGTGEAAHPRLSAAGGTVRWQGYLNVPRAGAYRFSALLRGTFRLIVAGKVVLEAEGKAAAPVHVEGAATRLEAGVHPLVGEFTRLSGAARLQLWWQAPHFYKEPLPHFAVRHLPAEAPAALAASQRQERGRFLAEEMSCTACHQPADGDRIAKGLQSRQGPDLSAVGGRVHAGWLYHWLIAPPEEQPGRVMPRLFGDDAAGRAEAYAVARYLASLGGPLKVSPQPKQTKQFKASIARGQRLFTTTGCIVCHRDPTADGPRTYPLTNVAAKSTPAQLAAYLADPLAVDPSGRMPHMLLDKKESTDLANFLCYGKAPPRSRDLPAEPGQEQRATAFKRVDPRPEELTAFLRLPVASQWTDLGKRLVIDRGCNNCHTIAPGGQPFANQFADSSFGDIKKPEKQALGCLASAQDKRGKAPLWALSEADRDCVRAFLKDGARGAGSASPMYAARVALQRFNCLACHARDGAGGLTPALVTELRRYEKAEDAEAFTPPPLTGVGDKLRTAWLRQVLTGAGRARPWMGLRMPQFGAAHVGKLPEALAALDGSAPDVPHKAPLTAATLKAGRDLVGKGGFGCISCHDIAGIPNPGTRGPDLARISERLRYDWYRLWLESAQRMHPGTKMPTVFPDGKSLLDNILGGNPDAQAAAMWAYLSLGPTLPLPEGLEPPKGLVLTPTDRPMLVRTFLPEAGTRAVAVGYPGGVSVAFDGATCRLAYGWSGHFLDAAPAWDNRGGAPAKVLGPRFWVAPDGCPWGVGESTEPPDFAAQARAPAFGGPLPEGAVFTGKQRLFFEGYTLDKTGLPTFRYHLDAGGGKTLKVEERPAPLRGVAGVGVERRFTVQTPAGRNVWLLAGESQEPPRWLDAKGNLSAVDKKALSAEEPAAGRRVVLSQGGRVTVLVLAAAPDGTVWHLRREGTMWKALLRLPVNPQRAQLRLEVWSPWRDDPAVLRELRPVRP